MALSEDLYHVGIVVKDLEAARAHLSETLGSTWGPIFEYPVNDVRDGAGTDLQVPLRLTFSKEHPRLELIQEQPGTIWECNEHSNLHHIGVWSDSIPDDSTHLDGARCPLALGGRSGDQAPVIWAYHRDELGFIVEIVDRANQPGMDSMIDGAPLA